MRPTIHALVLAAIGAALAAPAAGQVESHCLPEALPPCCLPVKVSEAPAYNERELSVPLQGRDVEAERKYTDDDRKVWGDEGDPDATAEDRMCKKPRAVVDLARKGDHAGAAEAAMLVWRQPPERYTDFTWDLVANAAAWSHLSAGDREAAAAAHFQGARRCQDPAVQAYHRLAASVIRKSKKSDEELKAPGVYLAEMRAELEPMLKDFGEKLARVRASQAGRIDVRLPLLLVAYGRLREIAAIDPSRLDALKADFRGAADSLVGLFETLFAEARDAHAGMMAVEQRYAGRPFNQGFGIYWNRAIKNFWLKIQELKRLCRIHDYLARMSLASPGMVESRFRQAHEMLFAAEEPGTVYQMVNRKRDFGIDMRKRIPVEFSDVKPL